MMNESMNIEGVEALDAKSLTEIQDRERTG